MRRRRTTPGTRRTAHPAIAVINGFRRTARTTRKPKNTTPRNPPQATRVRPRWRTQLRPSSNAWLRNTARASPVPRDSEDAMAITVRASSSRRCALRARARLFAASRSRPSSSRARRQAASAACHSFRCRATSATVRAARALCGCAARAAPAALDAPSASPIVSFASASSHKARASPGFAGEWARSGASGVSAGFNLRASPILGRGAHTSHEISGRAGERRGRGLGSPFDRQGSPRGMARCDSHRP